MGVANVDVTAAATIPADPDTNLIKNIYKAARAVKLNNHHHNEVLVEKNENQND